MNYTIPDKMQAVQVQNPGKESRLVIAAMPVPLPAAGELLLKVAACGVNRADLMQRQGLYPPPTGDSEVLGLEAAGTVVAVGDASLTPYLGQHYFGLVNGDGYAEYAVIPATQAMPVPANWSMQQAAATAETFLTAYQLLFSLGQAKAGERVLIHAGASGVGTSAIQLAKARGLQVAVTVGSTEKVAACLALGADIAVNYRAQHFTDVLSKAWPEGINLILDPVAGSYVAEDLQLLAQDGKIILYAMMGGRKLSELDLAPMFRKRGQLLCSTLRNRDAIYKARLTADFQQDFATALNTGKILPIIAQVFPVRQAEAAHTLLSTNNTIGKLVLVFPD